MRLNGRYLLVAVSGLVIVATLMAGAPATKPGLADQPPALSAHITVHVEISKMNPLGILVSDVDSALGAFFKSHETFDLEELQALEITGEQGTKAPLSKIAQVKVKFERSATTRPAIER
jgi:multidrug efflux pump subunit AcrB